MVASEVKNPALTKNEDTFTWTISTTEHGIMSTALSVIVYDANGKQIACDVSVGNDYGITISIYDNSTTTSVDANTYRAVVIGNGSPKTSDVNELVTTELDKKQVRTDLLTEAEISNTDDVFIPFFDTTSNSNKKICLTNLPGSSSEVNASDIQGEISGNQIAEKAIDTTHLAADFIAPIEKGGTGAITATAARTNLEITPANIGAIATTAGAGAHNAVYCGKNLGTSVTAAQWAAIANGTFTDLYIGDYWVIGGVNWRIAAFDYYYKTGDTSCTTHHVVIVPDTNLYTHVMNDTNTTVGAYVGSKLRASGLDTAKTMINNAFGSAHILSHRQYLKNAVSSGYESGGSWYDSTIDPMTEQNLYGCSFYGNRGIAYTDRHTLDKSQYPIFTHRPDLIQISDGFWTRDVATGLSFCAVLNNGFPTEADASNNFGVRPAFCICA